MPLESFGAILSFAAEMEGQDREFYEQAAANPACAQHQEMLSQFARVSRKNQQAALRTRQENVTEMILEPIADLVRAPFVSDRSGAESADAAAVLAKARELEEKAQDFYAQAAGKIKALPEVARALRMMAKKRQGHLELLAQG